jgi:hypothetical protein
MLVITVGTAIALDASAFWESAVTFHTSTPPRADSINLVGLMATIGIDWWPPSFLPIVVGLATAVWAGLHTKERQQFFFAMAVTLAASFMVSSQAFANYWLLVFGLCALALVSSDNQGASTAPPAELP